MAAEPIQVETDVLVIGSGAAGMYAAIEASRIGRCDLPISLNSLSFSSHRWAEAAALSLTTVSGVRALQISALV